MRYPRHPEDPPGLSHVDVYPEVDKTGPKPCTLAVVRFVPDDGRLEVAWRVHHKCLLDVALDRPPVQGLPALSIRDIAEMLRPCLCQGYKAGLTRLMNGRDWRPNSGRNS